MHRNPKPKKISFIDKIKPLLKERKTSDSLDLSGLDLTDQDVPDIAKLIDQFPALKTLNLSKNYIGAAGIKALAFSLRKLTCLDMHQMQPLPYDLKTQQNLIDIKTVIFLLTQAESLEELNFSGVNIAPSWSMPNAKLYSDDPDETEQKNVKLNLLRTTTLDRVLAPQAYEKMPLKELIKAINAHPKLKKLDVRECGFSEEEYNFIWQNTIKKGTFSDHVLLVEASLTERKKQKADKKKMQDEAADNILVEHNPKKKEAKVAFGSDKGRSSSSSDSEKKEDKKTSKRPLAKEIFQRDLGIVRENQLDPLRNLVRRKKR